MEPLLADYDLPSVMRALQAADAAGNTEDATQLAQIAKGLSAAPSPDTGPSVLGELGTSAKKAFYTAGQGVADLVNAIRPGTPEEQQQHQQTAELYKQFMANNPSAVPTYNDIRGGHDAALYAADKLGEMSPYVVGGAAGFLPKALGASAAVLPAMVATGAAQSGEQEAQQPDATPASTATAAALGGTTSAIQVPFLTGPGGVISRIAKNTLVGGPITGAIQGATANIPRAVASGDPTEAEPSKEQVIDSMIGNSLGMGTFGGAHAGAEKILARLGQPGAAPVDQSAQDRADAQLSQRIKDVSDDNGYDLKKVNYSDPAGAKAALDATHNGLAEDIKGVWDLLKGDLDHTQVETVDQLLDRTSLNGLIRSAKNKVKGSVGEDGLQQLTDVVGNTAEGRVLVDLVRQSNSLTDLFGNLKGGVSQYTDFLNPLARSGKESGYSARDNGIMGLLQSGAAGATKAGEALAIYHNPATAIPLLAGYGAGRGIDALTGRRSRVAKFVSDNSAEPVPLDLTGTRSILADRAQQAAAVAQQERTRIAAQFQNAQTRNLDAAQAKITAEQKAADAARLVGREQELRTQNRLDNNPGLGGFDRSIYDQTGLRPNDAVPGVFELFRTGRITPDEFHSFFNEPKSLMSGNAGNHIIDMLDMMARKGQLPRDPQWEAPQEARPNPPQEGSLYNRAAYEAQAAGNQARVTEAQNRVAATAHSADIKGSINDAIAAIGRTNNRADAAAVHDNLVQSLAHTPEAQATARQELSPLVSQIRHATPEVARGEPLKTTATARDSRGRPIARARLNTAATDRLVGAMDNAMPREPLTGDVTREGNPTSRLRAQLYKAKAGIDKPDYPGTREPDQGYLKAVADFHDKAVNSPDNPAVKRSYDALARETVAQFKAMGGLKVETWRGDGEPYRNSREMMRDVNESHHLWFLPTESAFGSGDKIPHPMLADTGLKTADGHPLLVNDVFRIVHDYFGHTQHGFQFGPVGEYNAFREHAQMYSDAAIPALAAETLGQNAWVNFGAHLRRMDGSLPKPGEADYVAPAERRFRDQKAYALPPELIARDPNLGREFVDDLYDHPEGKIKTGADVSGRTKLDLHDAIPGLQGITQFLTPSERALVITRNAKQLIEHFTNLPPATEMAAVAYSGRVKRGWYQQSSRAIVSVFGAEDAPRFAGLLAALSPQTSVERNLENSLNVWRGWIEANQPRDEASIIRILGENVQGDAGPGRILPAWVNNTVRALTAPDGEPIRISGPKVAAFAQNLLGEVNAITNDTWMANWAGIKQTVFKGSDRGATDLVGSVYGAGPGYLAMSALTRKAASILTDKTGTTWTPAEVQETVWSWAKALFEKSSSRQSATSLVKEQGLSHDEINSVPDFESLFVRDTYARILDMAGYGDNVDNLKYTLEERGANNDGNSPGGTPYSAEGSGFGQDAFTRHLTRSAQRLDALKFGRDNAGRADLSPAADALSPGEIIATRHDNEADAQKMAEALGKTRPARRGPQEDGRFGVAMSPTPMVERDTAPVPAMRAFTDPEGRRGAASFVSGIEHPDGTTRGLTTPEIRAVAKSIARVVEGADAKGNNGLYSEVNNTILVSGKLSPSEHNRVLGHETGHAMEALANVVGIMNRGDPTGDRSPSAAAKSLDIVKELSAVSRLERPHLWSDDKELEQRFDRPAKYIHEYRTRLNELFADGFRHYMVDPASMKKVAPNAAQFMRSIVNPSKIGKVISFAGISGLALPGIAAQALSSLYSGGDKEDRNA
jgi:hypothetical protein